MNRREFMEQLERLLQDIPKSDRDEALEYYESYFEDAGAENEDMVIQELGSPGRVAAEIKAGFCDDGESGEFTDRGYEDRRFREENPIRKRSTYSKRANSNKIARTILIIILAVVTFPLWAAVLGAAASIIAGIFGILIGLIVGSLAGGIGLLVGGVALAVIGVPYMATSLGIGIAALGAGLMCLAIGIMLLLAFGWFAFKAIPAVVRTVADLIQNLIHRVRGGER